jgi:hypothetical protein
MTGTITTSAICKNVMKIAAVRFEAVDLGAFAIGPVGSGQWRQDGHRAGNSRLTCRFPGQSAYFPTCAGSIGFEFSPATRMGESSVWNNRLAR